MKLGPVVRYPQVHALHLIPDLWLNDLVRSVPIEASEEVDLLRAGALRVCRSHAGVGISLLEVLAY
jgi:hypothetical protein